MNELLDQTQIIKHLTSSVSVLWQRETKSANNIWLCIVKGGKVIQLTFQLFTDRNQEEKNASAQWSGKDK